jgi:hypothetical protein
MRLRASPRQPAVIWERAQRPLPVLLIAGPVPAFDRHRPLDVNRRCAFPRASRRSTTRAHRVRDAGSWLSITSGPLTSARLTSGAGRVRPRLAPFVALDRGDDRPASDKYTRKRIKSGLASLRPMPRNRAAATVRQRSGPSRATTATRRITVRCSGDLGASDGQDQALVGAIFEQESSVSWTAELDGGHSGARLRARFDRQAPSSVIRRLPRVGDLVWVGADMRGEWRKGRVVLTMTSTTADAVYLVELEVPAPDGMWRVKASAVDLTIFPVY